MTRSCSSLSARSAQSAIVINLAPCCTHRNQKTITNTNTNAGTPLNDAMRKREPVILNIYDMFWTNKYTSPIGLGIFHTGVQIYGVEYAYGGHRFPFTGVFEIEPRDDADLGEHFRFRQSMRIGATELDCDEVRGIIERLGKRFRGNCYHLVRNNCNHFSGHLTQTLCGRSIPSWVNRLAHFTSCVPFLQKCLPKEWLMPIALDQNTAWRNEDELNENIARRYDFQMDVNRALNFR